MTSDRRPGELPEFAKRWGWDVPPAATATYDLAPGRTLWFAARGERAVREVTVLGWSAAEDSWGPELLVRSGDDGVLRLGGGYVGGWRPDLGTIVEGSVPRTVSVRRADRSEYPAGSMGGIWPPSAERPDPDVLTPRRARDGGRR